MAKNYKIDTEKQLISADLANLTDAETEEIKKLSAFGYKVVPKKTNTAKRVTKEDIEAWLKENGKAEDLKNFNAEMNKIITDKNGKKRKGGFLVAMKWFKKEFAAAYEEIKESL
jgi:hypothetical protein